MPQSNILSKINIGVRAHDYGQGSPEDIAKIIGKHNVACVQLAPAKSFPNISEAPGQLSPGFANHVRQQFAAYSIDIAVLGCYINPIHPDPVIKEQSLQRFEEHLRFARDFGCAIVGTETGSRNADCTYHPDNNSEEAFLELVDSVKRLAKSAEKYGSIVGIEGVAHHHVINTFERMQRMLQLVDSPNVQIIYDPVNFFPLTECDQQQAHMDRAFELFGDRIVAIHCKDYKLVDGVKTGDLPSGTGNMDHPYLLKLLTARKPMVHIILESTSDDTVDNILDFIEQSLA